MTVHNILLTVLLGAIAVGAHAEANHKLDDHSLRATHILPTLANQLGITTQLSGVKVLKHTLVSYGTLTTGAEQLSHVRARYTGLIKTVHGSVGDSVKAGDLLAEVESNESLNQYPVRAPIAGTIIQRHANNGEVTQNQVLFSIANFDTLWAELRIYPAQQRQVKPGLNVSMNVNAQIISGQIAHIIPELNKPYQLARVQLQNHDKGLFPGSLVEAQVIVDETSVAVAVVNTALQTLDGETGVFVHHNGQYTFTPLALGLRSDKFTEVISGIGVNEDYVAQNSYLLKAELEKSEAGHNH